MPEEGWDQVHNQRLPLLQPGLGVQRGGCRGHRAGEREGFEDRVDDHEPELGSELAVQRRLGGPVPLFQGPSQRPSIVHLLEHRPRQLAVRSNLQRQEFQGLIYPKKEKKEKGQHGFPAIILFTRPFFLPCIGAKIVFFSFFFEMLMFLFDWC